MSAVDHTPPCPPLPVVERCAATDGPFGGCHGATASGVNDLAAENLSGSLAELAESMRATRARWEAGYIRARMAGGAR